MHVDGIRAAANGDGKGVINACTTGYGTMSGAVVGTAICPGIGTIVGGIVGALIGKAGGHAAGTLLDKK